MIYLLKNETYYCTLWHLYFFVVVVQRDGKSHSDFFAPLMFSEVHVVFLIMCDLFSDSEIELFEGLSICG